VEEKEFKCHKIAGGTASGEILISRDDICFYLIDPKTGIVIEKGHDLEGRSVAGKVLVVPTGKGSSVVQADGLYQLQLHGNAPKALIIQNPDTVLVASAIVIGVPMVNKLPQDFYDYIEDGKKAIVNSDLAKVTVISEA
jgi:uncharacterized protein